MKTTIILREHLPSPQEIVKEIDYEILSEQIRLAGEGRSLQEDTVKSTNEYNKEMNEND